MQANLTVRLIKSEEKLLQPIVKQLREEYVHYICVNVAVSISDVSLFVCLKLILNRALYEPMNI